MFCTCITAPSRCPNSLAWLSHPLCESARSSSRTHSGHTSQCPPPFDRMFMSADSVCRRTELSKMKWEQLEKLTPLTAIPGYESIEVVGRGSFAIVYVSPSTQWWPDVLNINTLLHAYFRKRRRGIKHVRSRFSITRLKSKKFSLPKR